MRKCREGDTYTAHFDSLNELVDVVKNGDPEHIEWQVDGSAYSRKFTGVSSFEQAERLAKDGWPTEVKRALSVAEEAVTKVERDYEVPSFVASYEVAGCEVDVARYLDGTPENMIDYPLAPIVKAGKVITLCASVSFSAAVAKENIIKRGHAVTALALALSQLGYSLEVYADWGGEDGEHKVRIRTLIKGAQDALDPERMVYALAHPSMLRVFQFVAARNLFPRSFMGSMWGSMGTPLNPAEDLPEGTLYTPCVTSAYDVPDADEQLVRWLTDLGIIHPED